MKTMSAEVCRFRRTEKDKQETGIAISNGLGVYDVMLIVDINYKPVPTPLYSFDLRGGVEGCFQFLAETE